MNKIEFVPVGVIHTPFTDQEGMPIQPAGAEGVQGTIEIYETYVDGLKDLDGFSHIHLLYHLHKSHGYDLQVVPFLDTEVRGLFATRAPRRPNAIGLSTVKLIRVTENIIEIENVDMLDGTPLLDIKPVVPGFAHFENPRFGWVEDAIDDVSHIRSDDRFRK